MTPEYLAGFFDGEGTLGVYVYTAADGYVRVTAHASMYQNRPHFFQELINMYGGSLYDSGGQQGSAWTCPRAEMARFLDDIIPHLKIKREQAVLMREWVFMQKCKHMDHPCHAGNPDWWISYCEQVSQQLKDMK